ncbi:MAG: radical SAM family heme chaperone HemW [Fimbriimonadaceae bacterium]|nr:radical SAM family heme chaperone HemW [Fimbriimonadaceae bacterium]
MSSSPIAVYVHVPFCPSKCGYCDFNSYAMTGNIHGRTVRAMVAELKSSPHAGRSAKTIFFGGGTPTFLAAEQITLLLKTVIEVHPPIEGAEITSEGNPGTVDWPKFAAMREAGFNRISLGAQSFQSDDLLRLGRVHEASDVARAVGAARSAGFENLNLDLMFALPGQNLRGWNANLDLALALKPDHLSLYCLTIEPNTRFYRHFLRGTLDQPGEDMQVAMYDNAVARMEEAGYPLYEISNFAQPGHQSQHNLCYWRGEEYLGYGPGAVGCVSEKGKRHRTTKMKHPERYCESIESGLNLICEEEWLDEDAVRLERIMLGIRLKEGLPTDKVTLDQTGIATCLKRNWITNENGRLRLTPAGRHFCSEVATHLA